MKINREKVLSTALALLDDAGLEALTLRSLAKALGVQAATLYWHFESKEDLLDAMATFVLAEGAKHLVPAKETTDWQAWVTAFGTGLRKTLLAHRDGARMIAGTRLRDTAFMQTMERVAGALQTAGFTTREGTVLLGTVYTFTLAFCMEEQAVFPRPGERSPAYDLAKRSAMLEEAGLPLLKQAGPILFDKFDRRYRESLSLILRGAEPRA